MIAEIRGKISSSGSNLSDRLEDKLTGDVFGALRYLEFDEVIKKIADFFNVTSDYFYEYRLNKLLNYIDKNREFLDYSLKQSRKYKKDLP